MAAAKTTKAQRPAKVKAPLEGEILHAIRDRLGKEPDLFLMRNSAAIMESKTDGRKWRTGLGKGSADLVGCLAIPFMAPKVEPPILFGRFFALEVKRPGERLDPDQVKWADMIRNVFGGFVAVVDNVDDAVRAVERARKGEFR